MTCRQDEKEVSGKEIVIAMLQTLVSRGDECPTADFGLVIHSIHVPKPSTLNPQLYAMQGKRKGGGGYMQGKRRCSARVSYGEKGSPHRPMMQTMG
jgi:hypothetical protein